MYYSNEVSVYDSGEFSDLTILAGGTEYSLHKLVVCAQSPTLEDKFNDEASCLNILKYLMGYN